MSREGTALLDLLITTLMEHEKAMDRLAGKLEKIVANLNKISKQVDLKEPIQTDLSRKNPSWIERTKSALEEHKGKTDDFTDRIREHLVRLPSGLNFSIPKVTHTAYVKITETDLKSRREDVGLGDSGEHC